MDKQNKNQKGNPRKTHITLSIVGAVMFYVALYVVSKWFPIMTGHTMQSDWAVILVASVPLVIAIAYMVMDIFPKISAEVGGVKISLEKAMNFSKAETIRFNYKVVNSFIEKGRLKDLNEHIEALRTSRKTPSVLLVPLNGSMNSRMHVTFPALKQYIHGLAKLPAMRFIVFVNTEQEFLGFMSTEQFIARYPKTSLEMILEDMVNDEGSAQYWSKTFRLNSNVNEFGLQEDIKELAFRQWRAELIKQFSEDEDIYFTSPQKGLKYIETERDIIGLGAIQISITRETKPITVYHLMQEHHVNGVPVVDESERFLGMVLKDDLLNQLIEQFLSMSEQRQA